MRRHNVSRDSNFRSYKTPPRTYRGTTSIDSAYYKKPRSVTPADPEYQWIGKTLVYWNGHEGRLRNPNWVYEVDVANYCNPHTYRILFARELPNSQEKKIVSTITPEHISSRLNLIVENDKIINVLYY